MLPGFRFLFTAIVLSMSILVFGFGAAALLRTAHEEFASTPTWRRPPKHDLRKQARPHHPCWRCCASTTRPKAEPQATDRIAEHAPATAEPAAAAATEPASTRRRPRCHRRTHHQPRHPNRKPRHRTPGFRRPRLWKPRICRSQARTLQHLKFQARKPRARKSGACRSRASKQQFRKISPGARRRRSPRKRRRFQAQ